MKYSGIYNEKWSIWKNPSREWSWLARVDILYQLKHCLVCIHSAKINVWNGDSLAPFLVQFGRFYLTFLQNYLGLFFARQWSQVLLCFSVLGESQHTAQTVSSCTLLDDCSFLFNSISKVFLNLSFFWIPSFPLLQAFFLPFLFFMCSFISFSQVQLFQGCQLLFFSRFCAPGLSFSSVYSLSVWLWCFFFPPPSPVSLMLPWAVSFALPLFFSPPTPPVSSSLPQIISSPAPPVSVSNDQNYSYYWQCKVKIQVLRGYLSIRYIRVINHFILIITH